MRVVGVRGGGCEGGGCMGWWVYGVVDTKPHLILVQCHQLMSLEHCTLSLPHALVSLTTAISIQYCHDNWRLL